MEFKTLSTRTSFLTILFFGIAAYSNAFYAPFYLDDYPGILFNRNMLDPWNWISLWKNFPTRFLSYLSFAINYKIGGASTLGYHLVNLVIHGMNCMLLYEIVIYLSETPALKKRAPLPKSKNLIALTTALLFACHPVQTQAVTYIVQRATSMASLFYLATILFYLRFRVDGLRSFYFWGLLTASLSMITKEIAFTLPWALLLCEIVFFDFEKKSVLRIVQWLFPFLLISFLIPGLYLSAPTPAVSTNLPYSTYLLTQIDVVTTYLGLLFFPVRQIFDYDFPLSTGFFSLTTFSSLIFLMTILVTGLWLIRKQPIASFGIFWFFLTLSVESILIRLPDFIFEHRLYLPMAGFALFMASLLARIVKSPATFLTISILLASLLGVLTYQRNAVWNDELVFWQDQVEKNPFKGRGYFHLGEAYNKNHQYQLAADSFIQALLWTPPERKNAIFFNNIGSAYANSGQTRRAKYWYQRGLELYPQSGILYTNLAVLEEKTGDLEKAASLLQKAIAADPDNPIEYYELARISIRRNNVSSAISFLEKSIALDPFLRPAYELLATVYQNQGNTEKALKVRHRYQTLHQSHL